MRVTELNVCSATEARRSCWIDSGIAPIVVPGPSTVGASPEHPLRPLSGDD